jgi:murein DD-endopeptidase MepM/ murein hydrolase activator NlpD
MAEHVFPFPKSTIPAGGEFGNKAAPRTIAHRGVDFAVAGGSPIKAATSGVVTVSKWNTVLGNVVVVQDPKGVYWGYCHLRDAGIPVGTKVVAGVTVIGKVGNTGTASRGAHLHFTCSAEPEGYSHGKVVDPIAGLAKRIASETPAAAPKAAEEAPVAAVTPKKAPAKKAPATAPKAE